MIFDILGILPDDLKTKWRDALVDKLTQTAETAGKPQAAATFKKLRSDAEFTAAFEQGLTRAAQRFVDEYVQQDEDLVSAVLETPNFFNNHEVQEAMLVMLQQPSAYLEEEQTAVANSFTTVLPKRINRERVDRAVSYLLRCLVQELWHLPELSTVYSLQFQRLTAEGVREQLAVQKAQLEALQRLDGGVREAFLQLSDALAAQKLLPAGGQTLPVPKPKVYHNLPQPDYGEFVGREAELAQVFDLLRPYPQSRHHLIVIDGIGGIGKSTLALEVAHRCLRISTQAAVEDEVETPPFLTKIRETLEARFSEEELRTLCFDMALDYDMLPGRGKGGKTRELVAFMDRRKRLDELVGLIQEQRPDIKLLAERDDGAIEAETFEAIIWTSAKQTMLTADGIVNRRQVLKNLDDIYLAIAVALDREDITRATSVNQREIVHKALTRQKTLLIVDNLEAVDDEEVVSFLRELPAPTKAIVTTRHRIDIAYPIRLEGMPWEDAQELIRDECAKKGIELTEQQARDLFKRTGGVPLALVWSIGQIGMGYPVESMLLKLAEPINDIIRFCFEEALRLLNNEPAYDLLLALSLAVPDASRDFLGHITNLPTLARDEGLVMLEKLSLLNKQAARFSLLPLTKILAADALNQKHDLFIAFGKRRIDYLKQLGGNPTADYSLRYAIFRSFEDGENILAALDWAYEYGTANDVFALMPPAIDYLDGMGRWNYLLQMLQPAIDLAYATNNPGLVGRFNDTKGWLLEQIGDFEQAKEVLEEALTRYKEVEDVESQAFILQRLSSVARKTGDFDMAHAHLDRAHEIAVASGHGDLMALIDTAYGKLARDEQKWEQSWEYFQKVRSWFEQRTTKTPRDEDLAIGTWGHLAIIAYHLGRPEEAKSLCLRSIEFFEDVGTKGYLATLKYRLALAEEALGNVDAALKACQESLDWIERLGMKPDYPKTKKLLDRLRQKAAESLLN